MARELLAQADLPQLPRIKLNILLSREPTSVTTTPVTLTDADQIILVDDDTVGGAVTINLPAAADSKGNIYNIKKIGTTANVIVVGSVDGANATLTVQHECITIYCNGVAYFIL